jgi:hypothetical protein
MRCNVVSRKGEEFVCHNRNLARNKYEIQQNTIRIHNLYEFGEAVTIQGHSKLTVLQANGIFM